jgi:hypothetical protein
MKRLISVLVVVLIAVGLAGCSGISQETYNQIKTDYDGTVVELNEVKSELEELQAATYNSESLNIVKAKAEEYFEGSVTIGYKIGNNDILNVLIPFSANSEVDGTTEFGTAIGKMLANGEIDCDYLYVDLVLQTGKKIGSLRIDTVGNISTATFTD